MNYEERVALNIGRLFRDLLQKDMQIEDLQRKLGELTSQAEAPVQDRTE